MTKRKNCLQPIWSQAARSTLTSPKMITISMPSTRPNLRSSPSKHPKKSALFPSRRNKKITTRDSAARSSWCGFSAILLWAPLFWAQLVSIGSTSTMKQATKRQPFTWLLSCGAWQAFLYFDFLEPCGFWSLEWWVFRSLFALGTLTNYGFTRSSVASKHAVYFYS